jgi:hypothetical protein
METSTLIRVIVFMVVAVIVITWLDNKNIAARSQQHFANRAPAEHTMFVLCPVVTHTSEQVADAVKSIVRLVKEARWPEALSIGIVDLADKHLPHHDLDARVAAQCRVLGIPDVHVRYTRLRLPSDKQLRRNRTLHNVSTLEYARKAGVQRLYNREDYVLLYDPLHVAMESWWDSTLIDTRKRAIKKGTSGQSCHVCRNLKGFTHSTIHLSISLASLKVLIRLFQYSQPCGFVPGLCLPIRDS